MNLKGLVIMQAGNERLVVAAAASAALAFGAAQPEQAIVMGRFQAVLRDAQGNVKWIEEYDNLVTDVGARLMLDTILAGSAFTATTYLGLKGSGSAAVGDTQASHAGWLEVGGTNAPAYTAPRKTLAWSAASGSGAGSRSKASNGTFTFVFTSGGTVDGSFLNINGTSTIDNTTGTLFSAGTFSGGSRTVVSTDQLTVTYTLSA
jgi:hypothetical protein